MKQKTLIVRLRTKSGQYWSECPYCGHESKMGPWAVAHQGECEMVYTCSECKKESLARRRCCDLAEKVDKQ